jgi:hypothetical protein
MSHAFNWPMGFRFAASLGGYAEVGNAACRRQSEAG